MDPRVRWRISKAPRTEKAWGHFIRAPEIPERCRVDVAFIQPGTKSSVHRHRMHWNEFTVLAGSLCVWMFDLHDVQPHELRVGDVLSVPPDIWHQFEATEGCVLLERYWKEDHSLPCDDIERLETSGNKKIPS